MPSKNTSMTKIIIIFLFVTTMTTCISQQPEDENSSPRLAVDEDGNSYITWIGWRGSCERRHEVFWVKIDADGIPGPIRKVSTHPDSLKSRESDPQIAVDSQKNSFITWEGPGKEKSEVYWTRVDAEGVPGEVVKISAYPDSSEDNEWNVQIVVDTQGNSYAVWKLHWDTIYWVKIDAEGIPGEAVNVTADPDNADYSESDPKIAVDTQGNSYVVWKGQYSYNGPGTEKQIYWAKIDAEGVPGTIQKISAPRDVIYYRALGFDPWIAVDEKGNSHVVWNEAFSDRSGITQSSRVYWVRINAEGIPGVAQMISAYPDDTDRLESNPLIAVDGYGNTCVTWKSCLRKGSEYRDYELHWIKIDAEGNQGEVSTIAMHYDRSDLGFGSSEMCCDTEGNCSVVCSGSNRGDIGVYWVKIDAVGIPGEIVQLSTYPDSDWFDNMYPQVAVDAKGNFYVTWYSVGWHADVGIPYYVYWVRIDTEGTPGKLLEITVSDSPCESLLEDTDTKNLFTSASLAYCGYIPVIVIVFLLIVKFMK
ncbi:MAG: hypothetical protein HXS44_13055 [Theionarchaea archaeon]|nr:hypothetical protein [Theionarchaea archaeon]